jgi:hypothetical protein
MGNVRKFEAINLNTFLVWQPYLGRFWANHWHNPAGRYLKKNKKNLDKEWHWEDTVEENFKGLFLIKTYGKLWKCEWWWHITNNNKVEENRWL